MQQHITCSLCGSKDQNVVYQNWDKLASISVVIITKDEEARIRACLESVRWAKEIIVVDAYSIDQTVAICHEYTDRVYQREWPGYTDQKNWGVKQATGDWVLSLDADEEVTP
jgi:glycosyltransferase involved in cell wall biosynthesis